MLISFDHTFSVPTSPWMWYQFHHHHRHHHDSLGSLSEALGLAFAVLGFLCGTQFPRVMWNSTTSPFLSFWFDLSVVGHLPTLVAFTLEPLVSEHSSETKGARSYSEKGPLSEGERVGVTTLRATQRNTTHIKCEHLWGFKFLHHFKIPC